MKFHQSIFEFPAEPALGRADFLITVSNQAALDWIDLWPAWPSHALALSGPRGCGKTHLLEIWRAKAEATYVRGDDIDENAVLDIVTAGKSIAVDDADRFIGNDRYEQGLFHLYNGLKEKKLFLLIAGNEQPARWPVLLPDLKSRLSSLPVAEIAAPDDALLRKLFAKLFADRQITVPDDVIQYVLPRMERTFAAARDITANFDALALREKRPITLALAKRALDFMDSTNL